MENTVAPSNDISTRDVIKRFRTNRFRSDIVTCPRVRFTFRFQPGQETSVGKVHYKVSPSHSASAHCSRVCCPETAPTKRKRDYPLEAPELTRSEVSTGFPNARITGELSTHLAEHTKLGLSLIKPPGSSSACRSKAYIHTVAVVSPGQYKALLDGPKRTLNGEVACDSSFCPLGERRADQLWTITTDQQGNVTEVRGKAFWKPARNLAVHPPSSTIDSPTMLTRKGDPSLTNLTCNALTTSTWGQNVSVPAFKALTLTDLPSAADADSARTAQQMPRTGFDSKVEDPDSDQDEDAWIEDPYEEDETTPTPETYQQHSARSAN
ncbi:hypothetical protein IAT40_007064 [Kwoniella sp. CBS 6097]